MIGYLTGAEIKQLLQLGVVKVYYSTSTTPKYLGDLVSVYFFDSEDMEVAHQTQLSGELGMPGMTLLRRSWGGQLEGRGYERALRWNMFLSMRYNLYELTESSSYRIV